VKLPDSAALDAVFAPRIPDFAAKTESYRVPVEPMDDELAGLFQDELARATAAAEAAAAAADEAGVRQAAHSLKGMGGTVGLPQISALGEELSRAGKAGDFTRAADLLAALASVWPRGGEGS